MVGKIENGNLVFSPREIKFNDKRVINPSDDILKALGYKEIVIMKRPDDKSVGYKVIYEEMEDIIIGHWVKDMTIQMIDLG